MSFIPQISDKRCLMACKKVIVDNGLCDCHNRILNDLRSFSYFLKDMRITKIKSILEKIKNKHGKHY